MQLGKAIGFHYRRKNPKICRSSLLYSQWAENEKSNAKTVKLQSRAESLPVRQHLPRNNKRLKTDTIFTTQPLQAKKRILRSKTNTQSTTTKPLQPAVKMTKNIKAYLPIQKKYKSFSTASQAGVTGYLKLLTGSKKQSAKPKIQSFVPHKMSYLREQQIKLQNIRLAERLLLIEPTRQVRKKEHDTFYKRQKSFRSIMNKEDLRMSARSLMRTSQVSQT